MQLNDFHSCKKISRKPYLVKLLIGGATSIRRRPIFNWRKHSKYKIDSFHTRILFVRKNSPIERVNCTSSTYVVVAFFSLLLKAFFYLSLNMKTHLCFYDCKKSLTNNAIMQISNEKRSPSNHDLFHEKMTGSFFLVLT